MSYGFDMGFAQANSLQEAMAIALEYTQSQMTEKNIRKTIRDNLYYIPSVRTGYIADEESKNRRADTLADTADRYWLEALFTFRFLYWEEHKLLGIIMMPPENASEKWPLSIFSEFLRPGLSVFRMEGRQYPVLCERRRKSRKLYGGRNPRKVRLRNRR